MTRFTIPRDLYFGRGSLEQLKNIKGKRAIIVVGGGSMKRLGFLDKTVKYLEEAGMVTQLFENVEPDPSVETVLKGAKAMQEFKPDVIVSIGGGSPIDAAKAMWIFYEYPETKFEDITKPFSLPELRQKAIFVAIPSTSGTATEVTAFSVITDNKARIKYPVADYNITPDIAILDPDVADPMPPSLVAHTGMDALTHAIEAYVSTVANVFTDPLALEAIKITINELEKAYKDDKDAKEKVHYAQCLAGMAFSNALLGIVHSMAHKTGAVFHVPHGEANAIYLPYVIQFNKKNCLGKYADIARALNLKGSDDNALVDELCAMIKKMNVAMGIPTTLKGFGVSEDDFKSNLDFISENALEDACTGSNPRPINKDEMKKLFTCIYEGKNVDF